MLGILTRSTTRRRILLFFVYNRGKEFYLSEIARRVKTSAGTAQRELNRLLAADMITFRKRGNLSFYKLNEEYALIKEIEAIIRKTCGVEVELERRLKKIPGIVLVFIFGSYARGGMKSDSDIDLFIVGNPVEDDIFRAVQEVEDAVGRDIQYHIAGEDDFFRKAKTGSFYQEIVRKHVLVIGSENELKRLLGTA
jgi:predicted nucleotidyltransferase